MQLKEDQLKKFLLESNLVSDQDLEEAEQLALEKGQRLGDVLLSEGKINQRDIQRVQAYVLGIPFVSLIGERIDFETLSMIPEAVARNHNIIAYRKTEKDLEVAMLDVEDL